MSLGSVSALNNLYPTTSPSPASPYKQVRHDMSALGQALSAGNLAAAQQAFAAYQQAVQGLPQANALQSASQGSGSTVQNAISALGNALGSNNVSAAQQAYAALEQALQSAGGHMHHHDHMQAAQNADGAQESVSGAGSIASGSGITGAGSFASVSSIINTLV